ncbi:hypothetical protein ACFL3V_01765 [Nanoarchaeota archaeon]
MPKSLRHRLLEKGWSEEEIEHTMHILNSPDKVERYEHYAYSSHPLIYWAGLVVAIIGNFILAVALIPFLMILNSAQLYIILGVVGLVFGAMFNHIIKDIEHVDQKHHIAAGLFIPAIALVTVYFMVGVSNKFNAVINNPNPHSELGMSIIYLICFSAPYIFYKAKDFLWYQKPAYFGGV